MVAATDSKSNVNMEVIAILLTEEWNREEQQD